MDNAKIEAVLAQLGRPRRVNRPHRHFDGDYVEAPTGRVAYSAEGFGPTVLLVHGWDGSARDMSDIALALDGDGRRCRLDADPAPAAATPVDRVVVVAAHVAAGLVGVELRVGLGGRFGHHDCHGGGRGLGGAFRRGPGGVPGRCGCQHDELPT